MPIASETPLAGDGLRKSYDREAARYDRKRYDSVEGRLFSDLEVKILHSWLRLSPSSRLLDVPAGTGRLSYALSAGGARVVGTDISGNMLSVAESKRGAHRGSHVHFTQGSGVQLPFADNTFDAVVSFKFFHLIPNDRKRAFIHEMARVLKPGQPLVVEFNSPFYGGFLAALRYYFRKKQPGGMRMKCLFPDQVSWLFEGLEVTKTQGVKLPLAGLLTNVFGWRAVETLNLWFGRLPAAKYLQYTIIIEARKPSVPAA